MFFIDSFWLGVMIYAIAIIGAVAGIDWLKGKAYNLVEPIAKAMKDKDDAIPASNLMSDETYRMHVSKWNQMIAADHTAKMTLTGFTITILAALVGFQGEYAFTRDQLWLLAVATAVLFIQAAMLLWEISNDREAMFQYTTSTQGRDLRRYTLSVLNGIVRRYLQKTILVSLLLVIALIGHRVVGQTISSASTQRRIESLAQEVSRLSLEKSELKSTSNNLFDIAQHNSDLLQDISSQAEGGLMKTYAVSQRALTEIRELAKQQQEP